jgi:sugar lactone lactonase YvrE
MKTSLGCLLLAACTGRDPEPNPEETGTPVVTDDSGGTIETGIERTFGTEQAVWPNFPVFKDTSEPEPELPVIDCALVPEEPTSFTDLAAPRGYHDVAFDGDGNLVGSDGHNLTKSADAESSTIWIPNSGSIDGFDWLPDGDLVAAANNSIVRFTPEGGKTTLATDIYAYGVLVGPDGMVYAADMQKVWRIDPDTGVKTAFADPPGNATPRVVNFSPDYSKLYIGALSGQGVMFVMDLDEDLEPLGEPVLFVDGVGGGYHDGLGVDACGNLYVNDYTTFSLYKVTSSGEVTTLKSWSWADPGYGHGQEWGSGLSVWRDDAIYLPQPYDGNTVIEVVLGVPSRRWNGGLYKVINAPK